MKRMKREEVNLPLSNTTIQLPSTINYVTDTAAKHNYSQIPYFISDTTGFIDFNEGENNVTLPIFFGDSSIIQFPKGIKRDIRRIPKRVLKTIDSNIEMAIEKCFLFVSSLTSTVYKEYNDYWKGLSSTILHQQFKKGNDNTRIYRYIIEALTNSTSSRLPIIEVKQNDLGNDSYQVGNYSKQYRFHPNRVNQALVTYYLKFEENIKRLRKHHLRQLSKASKNIIGRNLIAVYESIELPTTEEILKQADDLIRIKHRSKKGKLLTKLNKKSKSYYSNPESRSFVEENINQFEYYTKRGFRVPTIGDYKSGGRVVDSFNLMSSWIRQMIKIENEPILELDFKALHPNIAKSLYDGTNHQITHEIVSMSLKTPLKKVKIEHLSFFNKRIDDMKKSPLFQYYYTKERVMLENIISDKKQYGYKITSQRLFKKEVEIMSSIIEQLNRLDIYVLYVYDALYCKESDKAIVSDIMNNTIIEHKVNTKIG